MYHTSGKCDQDDHGKKNHTIWTGPPVQQVARHLLVGHATAAPNRSPPIDDIFRTRRGGILQTTKGLNSERILIRVLYTKMTSNITRGERGATTHPSSACEVSSSTSRAAGSPSAVESWAVCSVRCVSKGRSPSYARTKASNLGHTIS